MAKGKDIIEEIISRHTLLLREALHRVYEAGFDDGSKVSRTGLEEKFKKAFEEAMREADDHEPAKKPETATGGTRAARGSAKPAVLAALRSNKTGLTTNEVFKHVGAHSTEDIAYNTVRGTLYRLMTDEKKVVRKGDVWVLTEQGGSPISGTLLA